MRRATLVHGFLGSPADWAEVLTRLSPGIACDCVPLVDLGCASVDAAARALAARLERTPCDVLVGYSMGARIALQAAAERPGRVAAVVALSGNPGLETSKERSERGAKDFKLAARLRAIDGEQFFLWLRDEWYRAPLWGTLREHPRFGALLARRADGADVEQRAAALELSTLAGQAPLCAWIGQAPLPILFVAGEEDAAYAAHAR